MTARVARRLVPLGLLLALLTAPLGCLVPDVRDDAPARPRDGLDAYRLLTGEARSVGGCRYDYRLYLPRAARAAPVTVVLGHGFLRDQDTLVGHARALVAAGYRTLTLDFCNMRPWNGHHRRNARDMRALSARLDEGAGDGSRRPVLYAGFSAGALAAVLAASEDPAAIGVLTLDLVDQGDLALRALERLPVPLAGLQGAPSACNAQGSGQRVFDTRPEARLETLDGASHCEFEAPTDRLCELACGDEDDAASDARLRERVLDRVVEEVQRLLEEADARSGTPAASAATGAAATSAPRAGDAGPTPTSPGISRL